jgi:putative membrane protein
MDAKDQATYNRLASLNGPAFDRAYMTDMVKDHRQDIAEFKREAASGSDPALKQFASTTLPTLEQHLQLAQSTLSQLH